jgi:hypothetical protein
MWERIWIDIHGDGPWIELNVPYDLLPEKHVSNAATLPVDVKKERQKVKKVRIIFI